ASYVHVPRHADAFPGAVYEGVNEHFRAPEVRQEDSRISREAAIQTIMPQGFWTGGPEGRKNVGPAARGCCPNARGPQFPLPLRGGVAATSIKYREASFMERAGW